MMADPAFTLSPEPVDTAPFWPTFGEAGVLGLNISPLIERYRKEGQDLRQETIKFIRLAVTQGFGIILVPAVDPVEARPEGGADAYLTKLLDEIGERGRGVTIKPLTYKDEQINGMIAPIRI